MSDTALALVWDDSSYLFHKKLAGFVQAFQVNLPSNSYGIPLKLIDPLIIAQNMQGCETTDDLANDALVEATLTIEFDDNMPIIEGTPIWERLDGEDTRYYKLFKEYREMLYLTGSRAMTKLGQMQSVPGRVLTTLAKIYHWALRCRAYDMHKRVEVERKRQYEIEKLESKHAQVATAMLEQAATYLERHPEQMSPKIAVQMIQIAMKAGRLAVGLNPEKPGTTDGPPTPSVNITTNVGAPMEALSAAEPVAGHGGSKAQDMSQLQSILHILDKSGALAKAQVVDADYTVVDEE